MSQSSGGHSGRGDAPSGSKRQIVSPADARTDIARFIRAQCIQRRDPTIERLAELSGIDETRLRRLIASDEADPRWWRLDEALSVWAVLRARAANASLDRVGMGAQDDETLAAAASLNAAVGQLLTGSGELVNCAEDFRIRRHEAGKVERAGRAVREAVDAMVRAAKRARS